MSVISVAYFSNDSEITKSVLNSDRIRASVLKKCYEIDGYSNLSLSEKNKIYDSIKQQVV